MPKIYQEKVMLHNGTKNEHAGLGEYLRATRINLDLDLAAVAEETKISARNLLAMEENNFAALPAEAFARGLYTLYAQSLSLDCREILQMYMQQRPPHGKSGNLPTIPATKLAQEVGNMAERPTFLPLSFVGLVLLLLLLFGCFLCWYFSWNPASYLSMKLRSLEEPQRIEQISANTAETADTYKFGPTRLRITDPPKPRANQMNIFSLSYPTAATASIGEDTGRTPLPPPLPGSKVYSNAELSDKTRNKRPERLLQ